MYIHIDLDCFFVSCERIKHPNLHNRPVAVINSADNAIFANTKLKTAQHNTKSSSFMPNLVYDKFSSHNCSYTDQNHSRIKQCNCSFCQGAKSRFYDSKTQRFRGMVVAKSYEAKAAGIATGTRLEEALRLCPQLIALPQDYLFYYEKSNLLHRFLQARIPVLQQYSIDEFFGDLSGWVEDEDTQAFITQLQQEIMQTLHLPVSIGASSGKWIAKLATNFAKPYGTKVVPQEHIERFTAPIPIEKFPGIGKAYSKKLRSRGVVYLADVPRVRSLFDSWGKHGKELYARIVGLNTEFVKSSSNRQSIGISRVFATVYSKEEILFRAAVLATHLCYSLANMQLTPTSFFFKIKSNNLPSIKKTIRIERAFSEKFYKKLCKEVIETLLPHNPQVYAIALSVSDFTQNNPRTLSLLEYENDLHAQKIDRSFRSIRHKYGLSAIGYGA